MFDTLSMRDLDAMDPAAVKALFLSQQDHYKSQEQTYTATLSSRASEIERLTLLVEKLQRLLFGIKSEKVVREIEQLEELHAANAAEERRAIIAKDRPAAARPFPRPLPEHLPREIHTHEPDDGEPTTPAKLASWISKSSVPVGFQIGFVLGTQLVGN